MNAAHFSIRKTDLRTGGAKPAWPAIILLVIAVAVFLTLFFLRVAPGVTMIEDTKLMMGTIVQIKVPVRSKEEARRAEEAVKKAFAEIGRVEDTFSVFKVDSPISRINRDAAEMPVAATGEILDLIERAIEYNKKTEGAFDITVKPLVDLWHHARISQKLPADEEVKKALEKVGSQYILVDRANGTIGFKKEGMGIDLGGVAKGYATDRAIEILKANGIKAAIVNSGGDMYCLGTRSRKRPWKVGIQHPRDKEKVFAEVKLKDAAIDTSGDYEKFFTLNGRRYAHIIDPRTGYPTGDGTVSATIIAKEAAVADMLATAACVLGKDSLRIINSMNGVDAILIYKEKDGLADAMSNGIETRYEITQK